MKPHSITLFLMNLNGGGAERALVRLANDISKQGCCVTFFLGNAKTAYRGELSKKVNIIDCKTNSPFKVFIKLFQHLRTDKPLIIMSALDLPNIILGLAASLLLFKGKVIMSQRAVLSAGGLNLSPFLKKIKDTLLKISFYRSDLIISNSCAAERELKNWLHLSERRIKTIHNGINIELIQEKAKEPSFKIFTQPYIISVGTLIKRKNHQFLLEAFSSVLKKHPCHLVLLGDGVELENLQKYCKQQQIMNHVHFLGYTQNPYPLIKYAKALVHTSVAEGFPNVIAEALALNTPIVATRSEGDIELLLENGLWGSLVNLRDKKGLVEAIIKKLETRTLVQGIERAKDFAPKRIAQAYINEITS